MGKKKTKRRAPSREPGTAERTSPPLSGKNGKLLLAAASMTCVLPMFLGLRLWGQMPEAVPSGFTGPAGESTLSRTMVVYGFPVLMCLLNLVAYWELTVLNRWKGPPTTAMRLLGRWGFPAMSAVFCGGMMLQAAGRGLTPVFLLPCLCGLLLMLLGSSILDTPDEAPPATAFPPQAGLLCLAIGLLAVTGTMLLTPAL